MRTSIVIVSYNSRADLPACLEALLRDCGLADEVIVVDCGSSDGSAALVARMFPQVRLLRSINLGFAGGCNLGARQAQGEYLLFLNPDTELEQGAVNALLAPLAEDDTIGLTTACLVYADRPDVVNACGNTMHFSGLTYCRGVGEPRTRYSASCEVDAVSGAAFALRRDLFMALGGFDEQFFMYVEDSDLSLRARLLGLRCLYVAEAVVRHAYRPGFSPQKVFYLDRNRHLMLLKNLSGATYLRLLPGLLLSELVTGGFMLLRGPRYWAVKPRVYAALWRSRAAIRAARRARLRQRVRPDRAIIGGLTHQLAIAPLAGPRLATMVALLIHPAFWALRLLLGQPVRGNL